MSQLALFPDATVAALISTSISISTWDGLPSTVAGASAEQLRRAIELLPPELERGRKPVLTFALAKLARR